MGNETDAVVRPHPPFSWLVALSGDTDKLRRFLQDLNVKEAEEVTLVGTFVQEYAEELTPPAQQDLQWLGESLLLVRVWC